MKPDLYAYQPVRRPFEDVVRLLTAPARLLQPATDAAAGRTAVVAEPGDVELDGAGGRWLPVSWTAPGGGHDERVVDAHLAITPPFASTEPTHLFLAATCGGGARGAAQAFVSGFLAELARLMEDVPPPQHAIDRLVIELAEESFSTEWALEDSPF